MHCCSCSQVRVRNGQNLLFVDRHFAAVGLRIWVGKEDNGWTYLESDEPYNDTQGKKYEGLN